MPDGEIKAHSMHFPHPLLFQSTLVGLGRCMPGYGHTGCTFWPFSLAILFTGELWEFLSFAERYPAIIYNILLFGLTSALGQVSALRGGWLGLAGRGGVARWTDILFQTLDLLADTQEPARPPLFFLSFSRASSLWQLCILVPWPALSSPQLGSSSPFWPLWFSLPTPSAPCSGWALCLCSWVSSMQSWHLWAIQRGAELYFSSLKFTCIIMKFSYFIENLKILNSSIVGI